MLFSLVIIVLVGLGARRLFDGMGLPGLIGLILVGIVVGPHVLGILEPGVLFLSTEIRLLALIIILLRAGLGLDRQVLRRIGTTAIRMSALPGLFEGIAIMFLSQPLLGFTWVQGGMLGFIIAAVSPAVVVPSMLSLRDRGLGMDKNVLSWSWQGHPSMMSLPLPFSLCSWALLVFQPQPPFGASALSL